MTIEVTAKKVDDAIKEGLAQLGTTLDRVTVEVLESGGLFRKAKVRLTLDEPEAEPEVKKPEKADKAKEAKEAPKAKEESKATEAKKPEPKKENSAPETPKAPKAQKAPAPKKAKDAPKAEKPAEKPAPAPKKESAKTDKKPAEKPQEKPQGGRKKTEEELETLKGALEFVKATVAKMGFEVTVEADENNPEHINITAPDGDDSLIIGRHGETLSALSYLAETCARAEKMRISVTVDCNGYRGRRAASLSSMARRRANECAYKHRKIKLEPMERIDRRTIHTALGDDDRVTTRSEGKEPYRYVVILPADGRKAKAEEQSED